MGRRQDGRGTRRRPRRRQRLAAERLGFRARLLSSVSAFPSGGRPAGPLSALLRRIMAASGNWPLLALVLLLPLFGQSIHYVKDLGPLWMMSKAWPLMTLPLILYLFRFPGIPPFTTHILVALVYCVVVPSFRAVDYFNQPFFVGVAGELKVFPLLYFFSFLALLLWLRPSLADIRGGVLFWGVLTFVLLLGIYLFVPDSWYPRQFTDTSSKLIDYDTFRGYRIRMPMFFGDLAIFWAFRAFLKSRNPLLLLTTILFLALQVLLIKQRSFTVSIVLVMLAVGALNASMAMKLVVGTMAGLGAVAIFSLDFFAVLLNPSEAPGIDTRAITVRKSLDFLGYDPLNWFIGVGTISPTSNDSLMNYFNHFFYLADIGWLGNVFEFGIVGTLLMLGLAARVMLFHGRVLARLNDPFLGSLSDQALYSLLVSWIHPEVVLAPGEIATMMAIQVYAARLMALRRAQAAPASAGPISRTSGRTAPAG